MPFQVPSFEEILNSILTDYQNQFPEADISKGSLIFIKSACIASALWGLYKYQEWISRQIFPDTADTENLEHHAWLYGLTRNPGESDEELLERLLNRLRNPPAGGNKNDYEVWAEEVQNVSDAYAYPLAQGLGSVDVVILADEVQTGSEIPSSHTGITGTNTQTSQGKLIDANATFQTSGVKVGDVVKNETAGTQTTVTAVDSETQLSLAEDIFTQAGLTYSVQSLTQQVKEHIDSVRPVTVSFVRVLPPTIVTQDVDLTVTGEEADLSRIQSDIEAYMKNLKVGETLYRAVLISIAVQNGAENVTVNTPQSDVQPTVDPSMGTYEIIRPGAVNVTKA